MRARRDQADFALAISKGLAAERLQPPMPGSAADLMLKNVMVQMFDSGCRRSETEKFNAAKPRGRKLKT